MIFRNICLIFVVAAKIIPPSLNSHSLLSTSDAQDLQNKLEAAEDWEPDESMESDSASNDKVSSNDMYMMDYFLDSFVSRLRSFIPGVTFDATSFHRKARELNLELMDLEMYIDKNGMNEKRLKRKVKWSKQMFSLMSESSSNILHFTSDNNRHDRILHEIIEFNAVLLVLFNSEGNPDINFKGYASSVYRFARYLNSWQKSVRKFDDVPLALQIYLQDQFARAYVTLRTLRLYLKEESQN